MDIRQVALGAAFGAAVAVNAALQSLQDAGSFLVHTPGSRRSHVDLLGPTSDSRKRALNFVDVEEDDEDFLSFRDVEDDEELAPVSTLEDGDIRRSLGMSSQAEGADFPTGSNEQNSTTHDSQFQLKQSTVQSNCSKRRKIQGPPMLPFLPLLPPMEQTEEAMSLMLEQTTDTVLNTLTDAKERREKMLNEVRSVHVPEKESSLKLVNSFIDALVNVSDSLKIVQSALFAKKDGPT